MAGIYCRRVSSEALRSRDLHPHAGLRHPAMDLFDHPGASIMQGAGTLHETSVSVSSLFIFKAVQCGACSRTWGCCSCNGAKWRFSSCQAGRLCSCWSLRILQSCGAWDGVSGELKARACCCFCKRAVSTECLEGWSDLYQACETALQKLTQASRTGWSGLLQRPRE